MSGALERRLRALELKRGATARPMTAFVIRAGSSEHAKALLEQAIESQAVRSGDPVLMLTGISFQPADWLQIADLTIEDLTAMAEGGEASATATKLNNEELHAVIVDGLPRVA